MRRVFQVVSIIFLAVVLGGCFNRVNEPNSYYSLYYDKPSNSATTKRNNTLKVDLPNAPSTLIGNRILYKKSAYKSFFYIKNLWVEPLPSMLQNWIIRTVGDAKLYENVIRSTSRASTPYILESEIIQFEHLVDKGSVAINIRLRVIDTNRNIVLKSRAFVYEKSVGSRDAHGAVKAFNALLKPFSADIIDWLE